MIEINFNCRVFPKDSGLLVMRVRWNRKKIEVTFSLGLHVERIKFNDQIQRAIKGTVPNVNGAS